MDYIIEEYDTLQGKFKRNLLVEDNRITYISNHPLRMQLTKMNLQHFKLVPGHVVADFTLYEKSLDGEHSSALEELVMQGCTTVVTTFPIYYERQFVKELNYFRELLKNYYLDYCIGLTIPIQKLTPSIIRLCQREKIPFISMEIDNPKSFTSIVWEWIREANFPYQVQLIPNWKQLTDEGKRNKRMIQKFNYLMAAKGIEVIHDFPLNQTAIPLNILKLLGIYPQKGDLIRGSQLDYALYLDKPDNSSLDYNPVVVVKDGVVIKARENLFLKKGQGKELIIKKTGIFKSQI